MILYGIKKIKGEEMNIDERLDEVVNEIVAEVKQRVSINMLPQVTSTGKRNPFTRYLGKNVFIRSVTHHYTGKVIELEGYDSAILHDAAWIADDGRFNDNLKSCEFNEVEPYVEDVQINYSAVLDITTIKKLPMKQK